MVREGTRVGRLAAARASQVYAGFRWASVWSQAVVRTHILQYEYHVLANNEADAGHPERANFEYDTRSAATLCALCEAPVLRDDGEAGICLICELREEEAWMLSIEQEACY